MQTYCRVEVQSGIKWKYSGVSRSELDSRQIVSYHWRTKLKISKCTSLPVCWLFEFFVQNLWIFENQLFLFLLTATFSSHILTFIFWYWKVIKSNNRLFLNKQQSQHEQLWLKLKRFVSSYVFSYCPPVVCRSAKTCFLSVWTISLLCRNGPWMQHLLFMEYMSTLHSANKR